VLTLLHPPDNKTLLTFLTPARTDGFIDNNIRKFVILNEVKNLFLHKYTLTSFLGQMLPLRLRSGLKAFFAQHDNKKLVSLSTIFPDVIEDLVLIRQGKSFANAAEIPYDCAKYNPV
jgi:hypothetical protein